MKETDEISATFRNIHWGWVDWLSIENGARLCEEKMKKFSLSLSLALFTTCDISVCEWLYKVANGIS